MICAEKGGQPLSENKRVFLIEGDKKLAFVRVAM